MEQAGDQDAQGTSGPGRAGGPGAGHGPLDEGGLAENVRGVLHQVAAAVERNVDRVKHRRDQGRVPEDLRIVTYLGHGSAEEAVVRGRVVDDPEPTEAVDGESTWAAVRRSIARFETDEVPGAPLRITLGDATVEVVTDDEGYYDLRLHPGPLDVSDGWAAAHVELAAPFRGLQPGPPHVATARVRVPGPDATVGIISDVDDTVLQTGAQRLLDMVRTTVRGSALTRTPFSGVTELYQALSAPPTGPRRPVFYVSSSPWNLHGFLTAFLRHREIPLGPLLLRDLGLDETKLVKGSHGEHKLARIREVLELHPQLRFVLVGDSGQHDPQIYAQVVAEHPDRIIAVWIREVRLDPDDGRVERVTGGFADAGVPFVLAPDSAILADHAVELGLLDGRAAERVRTAVAVDEAAP